MRSEGQKDISKLERRLLYVVSEAVERAHYEKRTRSGSGVVFASMLIIKGCHDNETKE